MECFTHLLEKKRQLCGCHILGNLIHKFILFVNVLIVHLFSWKTWESTSSSHSCGLSSREELPEVVHPGIMAGAPFALCMKPALLQPPGPLPAGGTFHSSSRLAQQQQPLWQEAPLASEQHICGNPLPAATVTTVVRTTSHSCKAPKSFPYSSDPLGTWAQDLLHSSSFLWPLHTHAHTHPSDREGCSASIFPSKNRHCNSSGTLKTSPL